MKNKELLRKELLLLRNTLSLQRRKEAERNCCESLLPLLFSYSYILSFASFSQEINLWPLNGVLCRQKKLLLPRIEKEDITVYKVADLERDLCKGSYEIFEPNPETCEKVDLSLVEYVLVPGLGFDHAYERLGYGKGHYDRILAKINGKKEGIGFKEQLLADLLPKESHDQTLDGLWLF